MASKEVQYYSLTHPQKRIWYMEKEFAGMSYENMNFILVFKEEMNEALLDQAINLVIQKNDSLRLKFIETDDGVCKQFVSDYQYRKIDYFNFSGADALKKADEWFTQQAGTPFVHSREADLFYFAIVKINKVTKVLMKLHHLVSDGWTLGVIANQMVEYYKKLQEGREIDDSSGTSYLEYLRWEEEYKKSDQYKLDESYWLDKFATLPEEVTLKPKKIWNPQDFGSGRVVFELSSECTAKIHRYCQENKTSVFKLFFASLFIYTHRITSQKDITIAAPLHNRFEDWQKEVTGMFVNTVPFRLFLDGEMTFQSVLELMSKELKEAIKHQKYPYDELVQNLRKKHPEVSEIILYTYLLSYQNAKYQEEIQDVEWYFRGTVPDSINFHLSDRGAKGSLALEVDYRTALFAHEDVEQICRCLVQIIEDGIDHPAKSLSSLEIISEEDKQKLTVNFNRTFTNYERDETIHERFEKQARLAPNDPAVMAGSTVLTYHELDKRANCIAQQLRSRGVRSGTIVGIIADRSIEMVAALLGVLKAGGAYLPIDYRYPLERIEFMIRDSGAGIALIQGSLFKESVPGCEQIDLEDESIYWEESFLPESGVRAEDLAYIMYTSGSTGKPKGVMVEHRNVLRLVRNTNYIRFEQGDRILQTGAIVFDACTFEIWGALLNGLTLCLVDEETILNPVKLKKAIQDYGITTMWLTSPLFNHLSKQNPAMFRGIKHLIVGGDVLSPKHINMVRKACKGIQLINGYGPTENTTFSTCFPIDEDYSSNIPIGKPIANSTVYILDQENRPVPLGVPGELCVGGDGVARGYLNRPELSQEKFKDDPFIPGGRMYRTGDLARWLPDGTVEFIGRVDQLVKIRGYRIEPGEIESRLLKHEAVVEAVVLTKEDASGDKFLCAYVVGPRKLSASELRLHLGKELPDYMIPAHFIQLQEMPLTVNGKIDRQALPEPSDRVETGQEYVQPRNEIERILCEMWSEVLGVGQIGIVDNFFCLGGNSLKATILLAKISQKFHVELKLREMFRLDTIMKQADKIASAEQQSGFTSISRVEEADYYPVSYAQNRLYVMQQLEEKNGIGYMIPIAMKIKGRIDPVRSQEALRKLIDRHEILRTSFEMVNGAPVQKIHASLEPSIQWFFADEGDEASISAILRDFFTPVDLQKLPLFTIGVIRLSEDRHILLVNIHHILVDGISIEILKKEFIDLYEGKELAAPHIRYRDYSLWQRDFYQSDFLKSQEDYWLQTLSGELPVLDIPTDYSRPSVRSMEGERLEFCMSAELTRELIRIAEEKGTTLYMVLLAVFNVLLHKYTGQEDIIIGTPIANRRHAEVEKCVGLFINMLPMRNFPQPNKTFIELLQEVRDHALTAFENQEYPFEQLVAKMQIQRDVSRNPIFDAMFVLQNYDFDQIHLKEVAIEPYPLKLSSSKYDLTIDAILRNDQLMINLEYSTALFKQKTAERIGRHFINLAVALVQNPEALISQLDYLDEDERKELLYQLNDTERAYDRTKSIHSLFAEQVEKTPDQVAIIFKNQRITYRELHQRAAQLARKLREAGVRPNSIVGLMTNRSADMLIGLFAILKAGGAYLPIDPDYPQERIQYMLDDSGAKILLTQRQLLAGRFAEVPFDAEVMYVDDLHSAAAGCDYIEDLNQPHDLAYMIYTSGSTGKPKGVMIEHQAVHNFITGITELIDFRPGKTILSLTTISFDIFVLENLLPLTKGLTVVIADEIEQIDSQRLNKLIFESGVEMMQTTPSRMQLILLDEKSNVTLRNVKEIMIGGEPLSPALLKSIKAVTSARIYNMYGPTETTVWSTVKELTHEEKITIGRPIANTQVYILDKNGYPVTFGVTGELCIAGDGLARGYYNRPDLTKEKFVDNPFDGNGTRRMYRTGDLAKRLPNGDLELVGRADHQVKVRGYRIELGEVEQALMQFKGVRECAVVVRETRQGDKYLAAYYTADRELTASELRADLSGRLPYYMVPSAYSRLESLPLTPNGKLDRKGLPEPSFNHLEFFDKYSAPQTVYEEAMQRVWIEILSREHVGVNENFFEVGGNSLLLVKLHAELEKTYPGRVSITDIFANPTIAKLARFIEEQENGQSKQISVTFVELPDRYFSWNLQDEDQESIMINLTYERCQDIQQFCENQGMGLHEFVLGIYIYLLSEMAESNSVALQVLCGEEDWVRELQVDFGKVSTMSQYWDHIHSLMRNVEANYSYRLTSLKKIRLAKSGYEILPLYVMESAHYGHLTDCYDLVLRLDDDYSRLKIYLDYNAQRLSQEAMRAFSRSFLELIKLSVQVQGNQVV